jgi:hypothetical protein
MKETMCLCKRCNNLAIVSPYSVGYGGVCDDCDSIIFYSKPFHKKLHIQQQGDAYCETCEDYCDQNKSHTVILELFDNRKVVMCDECFILYSIEAMLVCKNCGHLDFTPRVIVSNFLTIPANIPWVFSSPICQYCKKS